MKELHGHFQGLQPTGVGASGNWEPTLSTRAGHFSNPPKQSETSSWCGSKDDGSFLPARGRAHSLFGHPCSKLGSWPGRGPKTLSPEGDHTLTTRTGAELGDPGLGPPAPGQLGGLCGGLPGKGRVPEAFVSALPEPRAPQRPTGQGIGTLLRAPQTPSVSSLPHTPSTTGRARSRTHRPRHKTRCQEAIRFLAGASPPHPQPSPSLLCRTGSGPARCKADTLHRG